MTDADGPLYEIPLETYQPSVNYANYISTKQMINQVLNEDQEYVSWKLKNRRTAGNNMREYLEEFRSEYENDEEIVERNHLKPSNMRIKKKRTKKSWDINSVPSNVIFPMEIYESKVKSLPRPRELDETELKRLFMSNLDEEQMNRYEVFRRTSLAKNQIKKISGIVTNQTVATNINLLLGGIGKIFVGEIVEKALEVKEKWLLSMAVNRFNDRKQVGHRLKKHLKKLTRLIEPNNEDEEDDGINDSVDDSEVEPQDTDDEQEVKFIKTSNELLKSDQNTEQVRIGLIKQYNKLVVKFNRLDVSVEKYKDSPLLPEHVHEAWRLYRLENDTVLSGQYRTQGEGNGSMFR